MKYALVLNDMRQANIENIGYVHNSPISKHRKEIVEFYNNELAEDVWMDGKWSKVFKKGSPLEWFNNGSVVKDNDYWGGIFSFSDDTSDEMIKKFNLYKCK